MKYLKRLSALLIALAIFFTAIPASAFYEDEENVALTEVQETDYSSDKNVDKPFELLILPQTESGTTYSFTYDGFARNVSTKVGSRTLSSYTYNARSLPQTMTYGNGVVVSYGYDNLNRQTEFYVNNWLKYEYNYDGYSRLSELVDYSLHRKMKYEYDILGRPASEKVIDAFTNYIVSKLSLRYDDSKNRLAGYDVTIGSTTNSTDYVYGGNTVAPALPHKVLLVRI